jgi:RHH-type proline utilization regulon transcriptional repressor/proline dehydrogenase/delta 1-pyrroline-5-carboxylate dehydrogenase
MVAPDFTTAIEWQNMTDFGLTAGIQSLDEAECERWIGEAQAGNLYVNRGVTGAVVKRQPFGGWRRSSVGPTAKAGGPNYVAALRAWPELHDPAPAIDEAATWWREVGSRAIDPSGLRVERNYQRYRRPVRELVVRVDDRCTPGEISLISFIRDTAGLRVTFSSETSNPLFADVTTESIDDLVARSGEVARVRWLSHERAPAAELLERGVSVDRRRLSQRGDVEMARWLLEQSVAITYHRYGNVNGGPKPRCEGLG